MFNQYSVAIVHRILRLHKDNHRVQQQPHPIVLFPSMRPLTIVELMDRIFTTIKEINQSINYVVVVVV